MRTDDAKAAAAELEGQPTGVPLSSGQTRLWFLEQLGEVRAAYVVTVAFRIDGLLDQKAFMQALEGLVQRHEMLRTGFYVDDGIPQQRARKTIVLPFQHIDATSLEPIDASKRVDAVFREAHEMRFDLEEPPLFKFWLCQINDDYNILVLAYHHILIDGLSINILVKDFAALYDAAVHRTHAQLHPLSLQYSDFVALEKRAFESGQLALGLQFWEERLKDVPEFRLRGDRVRPAIPSHRGESVPVQIPSQDVKRLARVSASCSATLFQGLLAAFCAVLARWSGEDEVVVGTPVSGRSYPGIEELVGFFANTLVIRCDGGGELSFNELVRRVREETIGALENAQVPFGVVVEHVQPRRDLASNPLFQIMFVMDSTPKTMQFGNLQMQYLPQKTTTSKLDLTLTLHKTDAGVEGFCEFATDIFDRRTIETLVHQFQQVVSLVSTDPTSSVRELPIFEPDSSKIYESSVYGPHVAFDDSGTIYDAIEAQVRTAPDRVAIRTVDGNISYSALFRRVEAIAASLQPLGPLQDVSVGVAIQRSVDMIATFLALMRLGAVYVALDVTHPAKRLLALLAAVDARLLITQREHRALFEDFVEPIVVIEKDYPASLVQSARELEQTKVDRSGSDTAFVLYTSGTTGDLPKCMAVTHRGLLNQFLVGDYLEWDSDRAVLSAASIAFDMSHFEIWGPLVHGGSCVLCPERVITNALLRELIQIHGVNTLWLTASHFNVLVEEDSQNFLGLRDLFLGGEALSAKHIASLQAVLPNIRIVNFYGPAECTLVSTYYVVPPQGLTVENVPIGLPSPNVYVRVLDRLGRPSPPNTVGEICIGGPGVTGGYLGSPNLSKSLFIPDSLAGPSGELLYRSGDMGRIRADGLLEFFGRADRQVKIRGNRVELDEVELALLAVPAVRVGVVECRSDVRGDLMLVAFAIIGDGEELDTATLRAELEQRLPEYMLPAELVTMDHLPSSGTGKINRAALVFDASRSTHRTTRLEYETDLERHVADVFLKYLCLDFVSPDTNFFETGGHSLLAVRAVSELGRSTGVRMSVAEMFRFPTPRSLSTRIEALGACTSETAARASSLIWSGSQSTDRSSEPQVEGFI